MFRIKTQIRSGSVTVYGSPTCPWCKKQTEYLNSKGTPFEFIDCTKQKCPDYVKGLPTLNIDGKIIEGFHKI
ncbi:MAG: NrdH-redoxin [Deltaproteobacteria bacterium]|nr:MAG: NrdH-redoxin [Deltaproteobacteria bacterium]